MSFLKVEFSNSLHEVNGYRKVIASAAVDGEIIGSADFYLFDSDCALEDVKPVIAYFKEKIKRDDFTLLSLNEIQVKEKYRGKGIGKDFLVWILNSFDYSAFLAWVVYTGESSNKGIQKDDLLAFYRKTLVENNLTLGTYEYYLTAHKTT